ncbi:NUDIX domain-containing protein [Christensenellaceae bacterium NSJ-44]|uniref:NUDIX domain-containing protein n=2 Tax=Luoshenia tenuis TaxID=2763654 RepID=A0A926D1B5_9FIRM|nr:NUDIX domain-containing protein [Luoshenia tenuis]
MLTIYDDDLNPVGELPRAQAHGTQHWHRVVHVWLYGTFRREKCVFLQKRAAQKKTYPGFYDAGTTGHISAGETPEQAALREVREEVGLALQAQDLTELGQCREDEAGDREVATVFLARASAQDFAPGEEVEGMIAMPLGRFESLVRREKDGAAARTLSGERVFLTRDKLCRHPESALLAIRALQAIKEE